VRHRSHPTSKILAAALVALLPPVATAAQAPARGAFVTTLGTDTETVEQFSRRGNTVTGDFLIREPRTVLTHYTLTLGSDGMPIHLAFTRVNGDGTPRTSGLRGGSMHITTDSVTWTVQMADSAVTRTVPASHAVPFFPYTYAFYQCVVDAMRAANTDSVALGMISPGWRQQYPFPFKRQRDGSYVVALYNDPRYPQRVIVDHAGRITMVDGRQTTEKAVARRVERVDIAKIGAAFAAADRAGRSFGVASPRDTARASLGPARMWVDYSRPAARGRQVFGAHGVLGDTLWRTGADAATQFHSSTDLEIGGHTLAAGTYTLWTDARPGHYALIVNRQVGQWGTEHDPKQDLFAVPLAARTLDAAVERFTIDVVASGSTDAVMVLRWDRTELSVPIRVK
jgi:Protein of unknown function (DUF2911)